MPDEQGQPEEARTWALRGYQRETVEAVIEARKAGCRRMLVALPTGAGKTVIFSELIARARHGVLVLAHRKELLSQAVEKIEGRLARRDAGAPHRRRVVALEQGQSKAPQAASIIVASLRSLHAERMGAALAGRDIRLVIYDECHHAVADENRRVLERLGVFEADWPGTLVGFTATTQRADGQPLGDVFEKIVFARSLREMIAAGYLRPLRGVRIATEIDLSQMPRLGCAAFELEAGDYEPEELESRVNVESRNLLVARSILELTRDRRTIAFCVGVRHAQDLARTLNHLGLRAAMICGEMPMDARRRTLADFRRGNIRVLTNVGVLTEGFDDPGVSAIAMVRPTRSQSMYLQCIGRGMRLDPCAEDCLVLDFVDLGDLEVAGLPTLLGREQEPLQTPEPDELRGRGASIPIEQEDTTTATLTEIRARAAAFDPLLPALQTEVDAISPHAWISRGAGGLCLPFLDHDGEFCRFELRALGAGRYAIDLDLGLGGRELTRVPSLEAGVEAVDHELPNYGDPRSATVDAPWRRRAVPEAWLRALAAMSPPCWAADVGEAIELFALAGEALRPCSPP